MQSGGESFVCTQMFNLADSDGSGAIDALELSLFFHDMGFHPDGGSQAIMAKYDADASGTLTFDEFSALYHDVKTQIDTKLAAQETAAKDTAAEKVRKRIEKRKGKTKKTGSHAVVSSVVSNEEVVIDLDDAHDDGHFGHRRAKGVHRAASHQVAALDHHHATAKASHAEEVRLALERRKAQGGHKVRGTIHTPRSAIDVIEAHHDTPRHTTSMFEVDLASGGGGGGGAGGTRAQMKLGKLETAPALLTSAAEAAEETQALSTSPTQEVRPAAAADASGGAAADGGGGGGGADANAS